MVETKSHVPSLTAALTYPRKDNIESKGSR